MYGHTDLSTLFGQRTRVENDGIALHKIIYKKCIITMISNDPKINENVYVCVTASTVIISVTTTDTSRHRTIKCPQPS